MGPSFSSKTRKGTVLLLRTKQGKTAARLIRLVSEFSCDGEVIFLPNTEFLVTNWYHGDPIALGQPNIRENTFKVKEEDAERLGMDDVKHSEKSLIIEVTEV